MAVKYDGGIILGADARSANVSLSSKIGQDKKWLNQILKLNFFDNLEYVCW